MRAFTVTAGDLLLSLSEAKEHAGVTYNADDNILNTCRAHAQNFIEGATGRRLGRQTVDCLFDDFGDGLALTVDPVISVTSVKYLDADGAEQTLSSSKYRYLRGQNKIVLKPGETWPTLYALPESITVRVEAGWIVNANTAVGETELPPVLYKLLCLLVNHFYEHRELVYTGLQLNKFPEYLDARAICSPHARVNL
jgi:uncharacterized phiE125 gp8 family phage protein